MRVLVDGYNLLWATGLMSRGIGPGRLEKLRFGFLNTLVQKLTPEQGAQTTIVFDAHTPGSALSASTHHRGLTVRYSIGYDEADQLIEELIEADPAPKNLLVVSSDRRIQFTAKRRRAQVIGSEAWWRSLHEPSSTGPAPVVKPKVPLPSGEVAFWLQQFDLPAIAEEDSAADEVEPAIPLEEPPPPAAKQSPPAPAVASKPEPTVEPPPKTLHRRRGSAQEPLPPSEKPSRRKRDASTWNPFPPGYGDDLLEGQK